MTNHNRKYNNRQPKKDHVIDLTDTSRRNSMPVIRELDINPVTGCETVRVRAATDSGTSNDFSMFITVEDKGENPYPEPYPPQDPEPEYEERLEAEGATIHDSTTYFPASNRTLSRVHKLRKK